MKATNEYDIEIYKNIRYSNDHDLNTYDLYIPQKPTLNPPILVFIHGGAWVSGDKSELFPLALELVRRHKIAVALINYRLSEKNQISSIQHPLHSIDCLLAYIHIVNNESKLNYDNQNVYLGGHSAGGQLSAMIALTPYDILPNNQKVNSKETKEIFEKVARIKGIFVTEGIFDLKGFAEHNTSYKSNYLLPAFGNQLLKSQWQIASPCCITKDKIQLIPYKKLPKYVLVYSNQDDLVKKSQSLNYSRHLLDLGFTSVELVLDDFGGHDDVPVNSKVLDIIASNINNMS